MAENDKPFSFKPIALFLGMLAIILWVAFAMNEAQNNAAAKEFSLRIAYEANLRPDSPVVISNYEPVGFFNSTTREPVTLQQYLFDWAGSNSTRHGVSDRVDGRHVLTPSIGNWKVLGG